MLDALLRVDGDARIWLAAYHAPTLDAFMVTLGTAGRAGLIWLVVGGVLGALHRRLLPGILQLVVAIGLASLTTDAILKPAVGRLRPYETSARVRVIATRPDTASFPSGHTANAFAGAYALARLYPPAAVPLCALAALIAYSRVYVGVHYPLDVIGGALVGLGCGILAVGGSRWYSGGPAARCSAPRAR
jgi:undecaprenyl-diphosphatase